VIGDDSAGVRLVATQDHVAAGLAAEDKAGAFKGGANFSAGQVGGEFGHEFASVALRGINFDELLAGFGGDGVTGVTAIFDVELDGFAYVG
jgi:hypothetical protein